MFALYVCLGTSPDLAYGSRGDPVMRLILSTVAFKSAFVMVLMMFFSFVLLCVVVVFYDSLRSQCLSGSVSCHR